MILAWTRLFRGDMESQYSGVREEPMSTGLGDTMNSGSEREET